MTALVDFRGYRLLASSLLPIGKDTLQYGSDDMGKVVRNSGGAMSAVMGRLGRRLNIKEHTIGHVQPGMGRIPHANALWPLLSPYSCCLVGCVVFPTYIHILYICF